MKQKYTWAVVLGVLGIAVLGAYFTRTSQKDALNKEPKLMDTAAWTVYKSEKHAIEFKYPADLMTISETDTSVHLKKDNHDVFVVETNNGSEVNEKIDYIFNANSNYTLEKGRLAHAKESTFTCPEKNMCVDDAVKIKAVKLVSLPKNWTAGNLIYYELKKGQEKDYELFETIFSSIVFHFDNPLATFDIVSIGSLSVFIPENYSAVKAGNNLNIKKDGVDDFTIAFGSKAVAGQLSKQTASASIVADLGKMITKTVGYNYENPGAKPISYYANYNVSYYGELYSVSITEATATARDEKAKRVDEILKTASFAQ